MKFPKNIEEISELNPDFMGFIFYEKSPRVIQQKLPKINPNIKKVGVFVNPSLKEVQKKINDYSLDLVQLHGNESAEFCDLIKGAQVVKAFGVDENFNFSILKKYKTVCDYFLFDTKTDLYGGSGKEFDWTILQQYKENSPFFLSGGIGLNSIEKLRKFAQSKIAKNCVAMDVNSRFEITPGMKNLEKLNQFKREIINF